MTDDSTPSHLDAWSILEGDVPEEYQVYRRISAALEGILSSVPRLSAPQEVLTHIAQELEIVAAISKRYPQRSMEAGFAKLLTNETDVADVFEVFDFDGLAGLSNAVAPKLIYRINQSQVFAEATLGVQYQGPPGRVHGGFIAAIFDVVLARAQQLSGKIGLTGQLSVKYLDSTPINKPIRFEGHLDRVVGKKVFVSGACFFKDRKTAECNGIWVCPDFMNPNYHPN